MTAWIIKNKFNLLLGALLLGLTVLAFFNSFIQDDAFISFRYAENLAEKGELTWNPSSGENIEGYTNFLWTIILAGFIAIGLNPVPVSYVLGLTFGFLTFFFVYKLALNLFDSRVWAMIAVLLLGTNFTFKSYLTGGLETQLQALLLVLIVYLSFLSDKLDKLNPLYLSLISIFSALAIMTRLDSVLICVVCYVYLYTSHFRQVYATHDSAKEPDHKEKSAHTQNLQVETEGSNSAENIEIFDESPLRGALAPIKPQNSHWTRNSVLRPSAASNRVFDTNKSSTYKTLLLQTSVYLITPAVLIVVSWLGWKLYYYGDILPNTFYAKASGFSIEKAARGSYYFWSFIHSYLLLPILLLWVACLDKLFRHSRLRVLVILVAVWGLYLIRVGGDFMEFRLLVPILPFFFLISIQTLRYIDSKRTQFALILAIVVGSVLHPIYFESHVGIKSISDLKNHLDLPQEDWVGIGQKLGDIFYESSKEDSISIAITAAGAIPYYSKLETIDMLGLNDKEVALNGEVISSRPGHEKRATFSYLLDKEVNLVIAHPRMIPNDKSIDISLSHFIGNNADFDLIPQDSKLLKIPINDSHDLVVLYLARQNNIDRIIDERDLQTYPISGPIVKIPKTSHD